MHVAIVGPIATSDIAHLLNGNAAGLPPGYAGAPLLVTLIAELLKRGHRVTAMTLSWGMDLDWKRPIRTSHGGLEMIYVPMRRRAWQPNGWLPGRIVDLYAFERRGLRHAIELVAPDVVHAHWSYEFAWAALRSGSPTLVTCHDSPFLVARMYSRAKPTQSLYRWLRAGMAWHVLRNAKHVTAVSPYLRDAVQPLCKSLVDVVPNPVPMRLYSENCDRPHQPRDLQAPLLAMVANGWGKLKNPQPALRAFASLRRRKPGARLRMYGADFGSGEKAERWAQQNEIADGMEFIGRVTHRQVLDGVAQSDLLIHPSLEETFGMSIAEAMAQGVPVVAGACSGAVPWVVGEGGILVDVAATEAIEQALVELLDDPQRYEAASEAARVRILENFTAAMVVDGYENLYRNFACADTAPESSELLGGLDNIGQP